MSTRTLGSAGEGARQRLLLPGRFADRDCFVALRWRYRKELRGAESREFKQEVRNCLAHWRHVFPSYDALKGNTVYEYISEKSLPVDDS